MKTIKTINSTILKKTNKSYIAENVWRTSWTYIRTVVDTVREPFIVLDKDLRVITANETFYQVFQTSIENTENKLLYELGDGQWDIPSLRKLLEEILPKDTFFKGFEVDHEFPTIGRKIMLLNARRIHQAAEKSKTTFPPIILLAIKDISEITSIAEKLANRTKEYEKRMVERTENLDATISELVVLNKTVTGFNNTITELTAVIDSLKTEIAALRRK